MKALVKYQPGAGNLEIRDLEEPYCADNQVKIEVACCGICGTDLHVYHDRFRNYPPVILGHEFAGTIVEAGRAVRGFGRGDRVTVLGAMTVTCGRCGYCRKGEFMFCPERRGMGHGVHGAFARYVVAREDQLFRLPDGLPLEHGALVEPFAAAVHAVCEMTAIRLGDVALVSGPGPIGLMCLKLLLAQAVVAEITQLRRRAVAVAADISRTSEIREMFARVRQEFGRLDVLINNAGTTGWTSLFEITEQQWDRVIDTNLKGTFFCSLEAARMMRESGGGSIVNVSTNCAALGVKNLVAYAASKGGIHALTLQLAVELAPYRIRVNTFAPGPTRVERNLKDDPDYDRTWGSVVPMQRTAAPEEMVGPALFLASDQSSYMTGQVFYVDGGWTAQGKIPEAQMDAVSRQHQE